MASTTTIENGRARQALEDVTEAAEAGDNVADKYGSYVKNLPALIQTNGLGTAMAFVKSKGTGSGTDATAYALLYQHVSGWLQAETNEHLLAGADTDSDDLVAQLVSLESTPYRMATRETYTYLHWLRRLADGTL